MDRKELLQCLQEAESSVDVRVVVIRGSGYAFTAGQDVRDFAETYSSGMGERAFTLIWEIPKPVIPGINGAVAGIGLSLALV